jgi:crotonobetainyl-CoA:carnitine CoA-transferase CaiB-like acyl-CoA transferase
MDKKTLPYEGLRIVEFAHMVMGPTCGMVLADLGAEVIKIEPPSGDSTRVLRGSGAGFFPMFNRNKKSVVLDIKTPEGLEAARRLIGSADVVSENFRPGVMEKLGLGYSALREVNPRLVYVSHKGFLPGPYEFRAALDEVVQMMGGLAYMTGRPGDPLRAGASVNDIMGGMFGAIGAMAALAQREKTGLGQLVQSGLFENNVLLMAQHIAQYAVTGVPPLPMPARVSAWAIYDVFEASDGKKIFLGVVSDTQWQIFCQSLGFDEFAKDDRLRTNNDRVRERDRILPVVRAKLTSYSLGALVDIFDSAGLPYAPVLAPHELLDDPHLLQTGGFAEVHLRDGPAAGNTAQLALLPILLDGERPGIRLDPPQIGEHSSEILLDLDYSIEEARVLSDPAI